MLPGRYDDHLDVQTFCAMFYMFAGLWVLTPRRMPNACPLINPTRKQQQRDLCGPCRRAGLARRRRRGGSRSLARTARRLAAA